MAGEAAQAILAIQALQAVFRAFDSTVNFASSMCPIDTPIDTITSIGRFDYIIVGAGTAGSVLAARLTESPATSVLLIEAGTCPSIASIFPGYLLFIPKTQSDYNILGKNDNYSCQNLQDKAPRFTIGKMLGGSSGLHHEVFLRGDPKAYNKWADVTKNKSWNYDNLLPYFKKSENVKDQKIIKKYGYYHGTKGNTIVKRQLSPETDELVKSFSQLGSKVRIDINNNDTLGVVTSPLFQIGDKYRQSGLTSYISPAKNRPNLHVLSNATVTKIIFNRQKVATGVQLSYNGRSYEVKNFHEVIVSAGAIKSPQLLMLSGIGPADHLKSMRIPLISNLPVGQNLQDFPSVITIISLENDTSTPTRPDPTKYPGPGFVNNVNLDNATADFAQCQSVNFVVSRENIGLMPFCLNAYKYNVDICQKWYDANVGKKILLSVNIAFELQSKGYVRLKTRDVNDDPLIYGGYLSRKCDLVKIGRCLAYTASVLKTSYFKRIGAQFQDLGLCSKEKKNSMKFWKCYGRAFLECLWHGRYGIRC